MAPYPSSIPDFNTLTFPTPDTIDTGDLRVYCFEMPLEMYPYFLGLASELSEVNIWEKVGILTEKEMVRIYLDEVTLVTLCEEVANCINTSPDVINAIALQLTLNPTLIAALGDEISNIYNAGSGGFSETPDTNDLDYVWNGLVEATFVVFVDAVGQFNLAASAATSVADFIQNTPGVKFVTDATLSKFKAAVDLGLTAVVTALESPLTREQFSCAIFDEICGRGAPYVLKPADIDAGFNALDAFPNLPIVQLSDVVRPFFSTDKYISYWKINTDVGDNNWEALCDCQPSWSHTVDLTLPLPAWITVPRGMWVDGLGVQSAYREVTGAFQQHASVDVNIAIPTTVEFLQLRGFLSGDREFGIDEANINWDGSDNNEFALSPGNVTWSLNKTVVNPSIAYTNLIGGTDSGVYNYITEVEISGVGDDPF